MTTDLWVALQQCKAKGGALGVTKQGADAYTLILCKPSGAGYARFRLTWSVYRNAFCYWQRIDRPQTGRTWKNVA